MMNYKTISSLLLPSADKIDRYLASGERGNSTINST